MNLRPYQADAAKAATDTLLAAPRGTTWLGYAPTGSGKSLVHWAARKTLRDAGKTVHLLAPTVEIINGIIEKGTGRKPTGSDAVRRFDAEGAGFFTYKRYYNLLSDGVIGRDQPYPDVLMVDEAHHFLDGQLASVRDMAGRPSRLGLTATPYRGTPAETKRFRDEWGEPYTILDLATAVQNGYVALPTFSVWPLIDDDLVAVTNGEFEVKKVTGLVKDKLADIVQRLAAFYNYATGKYDRPTTVVFSGVDAARYAALAMEKAGLPVVLVTGEENSTAYRDDAFARTIACEVMLVQVKVVGEGVDLPLRRMIDFAPTMSPLLWMQRVGRITRPVRLCGDCDGSGGETGDREWTCATCGGTGQLEAPPEYIAGCHNITRHMYLWHGLIPADQVRKAQQAWPGRKPNRRGLARAIGLDGFGKFAPSHVPLADGLTGTYYALQTKNGDRKFSVFLHPTDPAPLYFERNDGWLAGDNHLLTIKNGVEIRGRKRDYGQWRRIPEMPDLDGCLSLPPSPLTPAQAAFWQNAAEKYGLDPTVEVDARTFQILPVLKDARLRVKKQV